MENLNRTNAKIELQAACQNMVSLIELAEKGEHDQKFIAELLDMADKYLEVMNTCMSIIRMEFTNDFKNMAKNEN